MAALVATKRSGDGSVQIAHTQVGQLTREEELNVGQTPFRPILHSPKAPCTQGSVGSQRSSPLSGCPHTNGAWNVAGPHGGFGLFTL